MSRYLRGRFPLAEHGSLNLCDERGGSRHLRDHLKNGFQAERIRQAGDGALQGPDPVQAHHRRSRRFDGDLPAGSSWRASPAF